MKKILIVGAAGMLGSALVKKLDNFNLLTPSRSELDLLDKNQTLNYFSENRPDLIYMCAAKVGGIGANIENPNLFFSENIIIQLNFFEALKKFPPQKALFVGSSCIYPRNTKQPMSESQLMTGPFEPTNEGYAFAKMAGIYQAKYLFQQFGIVTICPVVSNIYGPNDYYDEKRSHVIAALIKRFEDARLAGDKKVICWGTGKARREFIHVDDVADIFIKLMSNYNLVEPINVGVGEDISIAELANDIKKVTGFEGEIDWDTSKPDGMPVKSMNNNKLNELGIKPKISLNMGLISAVKDYRERFIKWR
jgi:GDP-L-fucose synthase